MPDARILAAELEIAHAAHLANAPERELAMQNHIAALGALIIQKRMRLSDRALVEAIAENPYYQYFIGLQKFTPKCPFTAPALLSFRKRLTADALVKFNEIRASLFIRG